MQGFVYAEDESDQVHVYETFVKDKPNSHDEAKCHACIERLSEEERISRSNTARIASSSPPPLSPSPSPSEYNPMDFSENNEHKPVEGTCCGIQDIIITGSVSCFWFVYRCVQNLRATPYRLILVMATRGDITSSMDASEHGTASSSSYALPYVPSFLLLSRPFSNF
jgi:hypothetical protein